MSTKQLEMIVNRTMSVDAFVEKWRQVSARETQASQSHFNDLCEVIGVPKPLDADHEGVDYAFEKAVRRPGRAPGKADVWKRDCFGWEYKGKRKNLDAAYQQLLGYREGLGNPPLLIVSDMNRIEIHTNFTNTDARVISFNLNDFRDNPFHYSKILLDAFQDPEALHPNRDPRHITATAAEKFGEVAQALRDLDHDPNQVARFLNRLIFCLFAESMQLFQHDTRMSHRPLTVALQNLNREPERARERFAALFDAMARRDVYDYGPFPIPWFNGGLFDESAPAETFPLTGDLVDILLETAELDWSRIDPAIFGTLFERGLDPARRSQIGAHYTDPDNIMRVVEPVVVRPLRRELDALRAELEPERRSVEESPAPYGSNGALEMDAPPPDSPAGRIRVFHDRLAEVRVLDPACGSGNFLYVAMRELKQLEDELIRWADSAFAIKTLHRRVGPANMLGIDIDQFAVDLTRMSLWIGDIQWALQQGYQHLPSPILSAIEQIECRDAILAEDAEGNPIPAEWPAAEFIVGNPPFLGNKLMPGELGNSYVGRLHDAYRDAVHGNSDLCAYWHEVSYRQIAAQKSTRAGLLATNSIRDEFSGQVLQRIYAAGRLVFAYRNEQWIGDGAAVRISIVGQDDGSDPVRELDGQVVSNLNPDLSTGTNVTIARQLPENQDIAHAGGDRNGDFDIPLDEAQRMLVQPTNVNGRKNDEVIFPFFIGRDLAQRPRGRHIIDFGDAMSAEDAADFALPYEHVVKAVKPMRDRHHLERLRTYWWRHRNRADALRAAIGGIERYIVTPRIAKHRFYLWVYNGSVLDNTVVALARSDDYAFGVLHSRIHSVWAHARGSYLGVGDDLRYKHGAIFGTFPFPWPLNTPEEDLTEEQRGHAERIGAAAESLNAARSQWLNPDDAPAELVQARTMTDLYNDTEKNPRPNWLINRHNAIDEAVSAAYGWPVDLSDDEILARLLALNLERAGE